MRFTRKLVAVLAAAGLVAAMAGVAHADNVVGDATVDGTVVAVNNPSISMGTSVCSGATRTVEVAIKKTGSGDPSLTPGSVDDVTISHTVGAAGGLSIAYPNGNSIDLPDNWNSSTVPNDTVSDEVAPVITITRTTLGPFSLTVDFGSTTEGVNGSVRFTLAGTIVNCAPTNTPPTVTVGGVTAADYNKGSVPAATCNVVDAQDGNSSFAATLSAITGPYASDGIGSQTASCSYTDGGGLTGTDSITYSIVDPSAPSITYTLTPTDPDGLNDWYVSVVTLSWMVTDVESPNSLSKISCVDQNITTDQVSTEYSCSATSAGGSTGPVTVSIKRDATAPTASASASPAPNANGWNNSDVTVSFSAANAGVSGLDACTADVVVSAETPVAGQAVGGTCTDLAGNESNEASVTVMLDKTDPTVGRVGGPNAQTYYLGLDTLPSAPTCSIDDALSGPDASSCVVTGFATTVGTHSVSVTGSDLAGNDATSSSVTYTIANLTPGGFYQPVDMGKLNIVKGGSTVPLKFEVFAGSTELTSTSIVDRFRAIKTDCSTGDSLGTDEIEQYTSGGTVLRYDSTGGQFIQNWQTPKGAGICYQVVLTLDGGSTIEAHFKSK